MNEMETIDPRPAMPVRELLEIMQDDPVELSDVAYRGGQHQGVDRAVVRNYVFRTLEPPLRAGLIRPVHFDGTAREPFLTEALSVDEVLELASNALDEFEDEAFNPMDLDFWFEATEAGDQAVENWQRGGQRSP